MTALVDAPARHDVNRAGLARSARTERSMLLALSTPALLLVGFVMLVPITWLFILSGFDTAGHLSLANYARLLRPAYLNSFVVTFQISGIVTLGCVLLGYPVAYLLAQSEPRTARLLIFGVILPFWTPVLVRAYAWLVLLQRQGLINTLLQALGITDHPLPLVNNMFGASLGMLHALLPFFILPLYASMRTIDAQLMRAAATCGATPAQAFRQVFLPLSVPGLLSGTGLTFVLCLGYYVTPALLGGGRVSMWSMQIADAISLFGNWGAASALGVSLLVVTALILFALNRLVALATAIGSRS